MATLSLKERAVFHACDGEGAMMSKRKKIEYMVDL